MPISYNILFVIKLLDEIQKVEGFEALLNELKIRGYSVGVVVVEIRDKDNKKQKVRPLLNVDDFLKKLLLLKMELVRIEMIMIYYF